LMRMFLKKTDLAGLLEHLSRTRQVYVPSGPRFELLSGKPAKQTKIDLNRKTFFSAKKLFLPAREVLFEFDGKGKTTAMPKPARIQAPKTVLFGARPCDLNAIKYMDMVFNDDPYYMKKRQATLLIGVQCTSPQLFDNCYCHYTGTFFADNYDLLLLHVAGKDSKGGKGGFLVKAGSAEGKRLLATRFFSKSGKSNENQMDEKLEMLRKQFKKLTKGKIRAETKINEQAIEAMAQDCYSCTACTSVCPTCHSFLIEDELDIDRKSGKRVRKWDSCQLKRYTRISGNVVFRPERLQRVRQRIYCKFRYSLEDQGMMSCTGCGRCIDVCNKKIDIFDVFDGNGKEPAK